MVVFKSQIDARKVKEEYHVGRFGTVEVSNEGITDINELSDDDELEFDRHDAVLSLLDMNEICAVVDSKRDLAFVHEEITPSLIDDRLSDRYIMVRLDNDFVTINDLAREDPTVESVRELFNENAG